MRATLLPLFLIMLHVPNATLTAQHGPASTTAPATGRFLIASRTLRDPSFAESVLLLLSAGAQGSMGIMINRPTPVRVAVALPTVKELAERPDLVFLGGPVALNAVLLLIRAPHAPKSSRLIFGDVYVTGNVDALRHALTTHAKTARLRTYAGYAGWGAGQLEREIARGDWYVAPADAATIFDQSPDEIWPKLIERFSSQWTKLDLVSDF